MKPKPTGIAGIGRYSIPPTKPDTGTRYSPLKGDTDTRGAYERGISRYQRISQQLSSLVCPGCNQPFTPVRPKQLHCRPTCSARAQRKAQPSLPLADLERALFGPPDDGGVSR